MKAGRTCTNNLRLPSTGAPPAAADVILMQAPSKYLWFSAWCLLSLLYCLIAGPFADHSSEYTSLQLHKIQSWAGATPGNRSADQNSVSLHRSSSDCGPSSLPPSDLQAELAGFPYPLLPALFVFGELPFAFFLLCSLFVFLLCFSNVSNAFSTVAPYGVALPQARDRWKRVARIELLLDIGCRVIVPAVLSFCCAVIHVLLWKLVKQDSADKVYWMLMNASERDHEHVVLGPCIKGKSNQA
jgi:hypothetical protein